MRIEVHYFADDDTEFDTREECEAYERSLRVNFESITFFDRELNIMHPEKDGADAIAANSMYLKILDSEKAAHLINWLYGYVGMCIDGLGDLVTGDIYAWDGDEYGWFCPSRKLRELQKIVDAVEKAVSQLG